MWCRSAVVALLAGCSFDITGVDFATGGSIDGPAGGLDALSDVDLFAASDLAAARSDLAASCPSGKPPTHVDDLAEGDLSNWTAESPLPWFGKIPPDSKVEADNKGPAAGLISVRLTESSDKAILTYPKAKNAGWNLTNYTSFQFSVAADDSIKQNDPGWQETDPHVRLFTSDNDYFTYVPDLNKLPRNPGTWILLEIPLSGGGGWSRTSTGNPSLGNINWIAWSVDTSGFGFRMWLDGVTFGPGPFVDCTP